MKKLAESLGLDVEVTKMTKSFKVVLLNSLLESNGFQVPLTLDDLSDKALDFFNIYKDLSCQ